MTCGARFSVLLPGFSRQFLSFWKAGGGLKFAAARLKTVMKKYVEPVAIKHFSTSMFYARN
jgi:hypothetical protein